MTKGRMAGAVEFFPAGDINIEMRVGNVDEDLQGLDSIEWYGMYGPGCKSGGEDVITYEKWMATVTDGVHLHWTNSDEGLGISGSQEAT